MVLSFEEPCALTQNYSQVLLNVLVQTEPIAFKRLQSALSNTVYKLSVYYTV